MKCETAILLVEKLADGEASAEEKGARGATRFVSVYR